MKASEANLLLFLKKSPQFVIPIYQRTYSWTERECAQLWDDIIRAGRSEDVHAHFVGSVVYIEEGAYHVSSQSPLLVIDGQQRLTTVSLLLEALARHLGNTEPLDGFSAKKIRSYYLLNQLEEGERGFKLILTQTDKESLLALMQQRALPKVHSVRINQIFDYFNERLDRVGQDLVLLCKGLAKLMIVDVALTRDQDNPQLIFESMNSMGLELSQADLIRNFILMGLDSKHQTRLYEDSWRPIEIEFGQEAYGLHFDSFMRDYLTLKTGAIPNVRAVYEAFKAYWHQTEVEARGVDHLVRDIRIFAGYYAAMALGQETDKVLADCFQDLRELKVDVAYPLMLELYQDYATKSLSCKDFISAVRLIEAYVFRRAICAIPTNSLNKTFATFRRDLKKNSYLESIQAALLLLPSYRRFPSDEEFKRDFMVRDLYNFPRRSYWLRRLENHGRKERVAVDEYSIEHIMPQNPNLSAQWRKDLGPDWETVRERKLHTLGNLTLTGYNSEYSDHPFLEKRDTEGGFKESPLHLNEGLALIEIWDEAAIGRRAERLAGIATKAWTSPKIDIDVLDGYRPKTDKAETVYSIDDHMNLSDSAPMRELFEVLRKAILALDPCVTEEFLKLYVAYKAETNFVDVVPQASRLRLSLNMKFHELHDTRGVAKDVTNLGRWGNGDVEVGLTSGEELPYVLGLIRQSFEKQMGNGESED